MLKEIFIVLLFYSVVINCDESPGFFLKISKNVPRIGRRSKDYEEFFMKQAKNVPRIGRRDNYIDTDSKEDGLPLIFSKFLRQTRKIDYSTPKYYNHIRPIDSKHIYNQIADDLLDGSKLKFVSWDDFDKALESDTALLDKLHSVAKEKSVDEMLKLVNTKPNMAFVPLDDNHYVVDDGDGGGGTDADNLFYRTERSFDNNFLKIGNHPTQQRMPADNNLMSDNRKLHFFNKEKLDY